MSERGRPFQPGNQFGRGRPPGSPNKKSLVLQELLLARSEEILLKVIDRAKKGDPVALKLCVERLIPRLKDVDVLPVEQSQEKSPGMNVVYRNSDGKEIEMGKPVTPGPKVLAAEKEQCGSTGQSEERGGQQRTSMAMPSERGQTSVGPGPNELTEAEIAVLRTVMETTFSSGQGARKPVAGERSRDPVGNAYKSPWS